MKRLISLAALLIAASATVPGGSANAHEAKLPAPVISEELTIARRSVDVLGSTMSYLEDGRGKPVLFIHGNPTSAYLWRNVIPYISDTNRAIAVDLIGMGHSGKPDIEYSYADQYAYLEAFIEALDLRDITLVVHDWGATLGWDYARQNPDRVIRIAFMEGVLPPAFPITDISAMGETGQALTAMRTPGQGEQMVLEGNMFVEQMLPGFVNRPLGTQAMTEYRAPFLNSRSVGQHCSGRANFPSRASPPTRPQLWRKSAISCRARRCRPSFSTPTPASLVRPNLLSGIRRICAAPRPPTLVRDFT